jgi:hypothetical protein
MGIPFGFSVGDVIAGIGVIKASIDALHSSHGAAKDYQQLSNKLGTLSESLNSVRAIPINPLEDTQQHAAIIGAVQRCQQSINFFLNRITKYELLKQDNLPRNWTVKVITAVKKIQWALCERGDIEKFTQDVRQQIDEIGLLIPALQM